MLSRCLYVCIMAVPLLLASCEPLCIVWSPDSHDLLALARNPSDSGADTPMLLALLPADLASTTSVRLVDSVGRGVIGRPAWSPDGRNVAYYRYTAEAPDEQQAPITVLVDVVIWRMGEADTTVIGQVLWPSVADPISPLSLERLLPAPAWAWDSRTVFCADHSELGYMIEKIRIDSHERVPIMRSSSPFIWSSTVDAVIAAVRNDQIVVRQLDSGKEEAVAVQDIGTGSSLVFDARLSTGAISSGGLVKVIDVNRQQVQTVRPSVAAKIRSIWLSSEGDYLYYMAISPVGANEQEVCKVHRYDLDKNRGDIVMVCPTSFIGERLSVSPDAARLYILGRCASDGVWCIVDERGKIVLRLDKPSFDAP